MKLNCSDVGMPCSNTSKEFVLDSVTGERYNVGWVCRVFPAPSWLLFSGGAPAGTSSRWVLDTKSLASDQRELERTLAAVQNVNRKVEQSHCGACEILPRAGTQRCLSEIW